MRDKMEVTLNIKIDPKLVSLIAKDLEMSQYELTEEDVEEYFVGIFHARVSELVEMFEESPT